MEEPLQPSGNGRTPRLLEEGPETREASLTDLRTEGLVKIYRGRKVVDSVSIRVRRGQVVGLLGPNGAGKTTTFYGIVGLVRPEEGRVFLNGEDITRLPIYQRARRGISYLPQEPSVFRRLSVADNLKAILETRGLHRDEQERRLQELLSDFGLEHLRDQPAYALSGGERRRTEIARALVLEPSFVLLDEPFAGIDPIAVLDIQRLVKRLTESGIGVLITDHNVRETLRITNRAYIIKEGKIFREGRPEGLALDGEVRRTYLGEGFQL